MISANSKDTSEIRIINSANPLSEQFLIQPRENGIKYYLDHADNQFYCVTNRDNAINFKLLVCNSTKLLSKSKQTNFLWDELIPHSEEASILDVDIFKVRTPK